MREPHGAIPKALAKGTEDIILYGWEKARREQKAYIVNTNGLLLFLYSYFYSLRKAGHEVLQRLTGFSPFPGGQDLDVESQKFPAAKSKVNLFPFFLLYFLNMYPLYSGYCVYQIQLNFLADPELICANGSHKIRLKDLFRLSSTVTVYQMGS